MRIFSQQNNKCQWAWGKVNDLMCLSGTKQKPKRTQNNCERHMRHAELMLEAAVGGSNSAVVTPGILKHIKQNMHCD